MLWAIYYESQRLSTGHTLREAVALVNALGVTGTAEAVRDLTR